MDLAYLIEHPQELNQETLYDLRRLVAIYPTYHAARILFLQNLFLLHDPTFDQELRRAALLVPDRRVLYALTHTISNLASEKPQNEKAQPAATTPQPAVTQAAEDSTVAAPATQPETPATQPAATNLLPEAATKAPKKKYAAPDTTARLLDDFLDTTPRPLTKKRIKADPATDYMAYLLQQEDEEPEPLVADEVAESPQQQAANTTSRLDDLIDSFIASSEEGIKLSEDPMIPEEFQEIEEVAEEVPEVTEEIPKATEEPSSSSELTEQLAQIYIKQGKYERAMEILNKINGAENSSTNPFLADQMRYLQKLAALKARKTTNQK